MKILNCYIKGFGTYNNQTFTFHDGLNCLYEENGQGKTTLACFIKAMLYGLESYKDNSKDFKDRKHYKPFNNASFGGSLTFTHNNNTYTVERTFDAKSQEKDLVNVYVNDVLENFEKEIGEEILHLDKDAFERLMYINASDIKIESNSNLKKHLNNIIDATDESFDYEKIDKNITQHKNRYGRNKDSLINKEKDQSSDLLKEIKDTEQISSELTFKYENYNALNKQREELNNKVSQQGFYKSYQEKQNNLLQDKDKLTQLTNNYPFSYPNEKEIEILLENSIKIKQLTNDNASLNDNLDIKKQYPLGLPNSEETNTLQALFTKKEELHKDLLANSYDENKLSFYQSLPLNEDNIHTLSDKYEQYKNSSTLAPYESELLNKYDNTSCLKDIETIKQLENTTSSKKINKSLIVILILLVILLVSGITLIFISQLLGIILTILGLLGLVAVGFIYLTKKIDNKNNSLNTKTINQINDLLRPYGYNYDNLLSFKNDIQLYQKVLEKNDYNANLNLENNLLEFIKKFGDFNNINDGYKTILSYWQEYQNILDKKGKQEEYLSLENDNQQEINKILTKYHIETDFNTYKEYKWFIEGEQQKLDKQKEMVEKENKIKECQNIIDNIYSKYHLENKNLNEIKVECEKIKRLQESISKQEQELINYQKEHNIDDLLENIDFKDSLDKINQKIENLKAQITADEAKVSLLPSLRQEYTQSQQNIKKYQHNVVILEYIASYLSKAQSNLDQKYVQPIKETFDKYLKILANVADFSIAINRDFATQLNVQGETKSSEYLSSAQLCMCTLCLRLALADNIYKSDIPFLIMDDPFVYLDANNMKLVNNLLREVLNTKQIIYLTCHESRKISI